MLMYMQKHTQKINPYLLESWVALIKNFLHLIVIPFLCLTRSFRWCICEYTDQHHSHILNFQDAMLTLHLYWPHYLTLSMLQTLFLMVFLFKFLWFSSASFCFSSSSSFQPPEYINKRGSRLAPAVLLFNFSRS